MCADDSDNRALVTGYVRLNNQGVPWCSATRFHIECLHMEEDDIPEGVWYYSTSCEEDNVKKKQKENHNCKFTCRSNIALSSSTDVERVFPVVKERCP